MLIRSLILIISSLAWITAIQIAIEAAAGILKRHILLFPEELHPDRFKHSRLHQGLAEFGSFETGHFARTEVDVLHEVAQNHVYSIRAGEAVVVDTQVLPAGSELHLCLQSLNDVLPQLSGFKRP